MAYKYNGTTLRVGRSWTDADGVTHPTNWGTWSEEEKTEKGIIWEDDPAPFDSRWYWSADLPRALEDVDAVDENGDPILDEDGVQLVTKGLKSTEIAKIKAQAGGLLAPTDWMVIKASEVAEYTLPADVATYRAAVRTTSNEMEAKITACTTLEELIALFTATLDEEQNYVPAPIGEWPEL